MFMLMMADEWADCCSIRMPIEDRTILLKRG